MKTQILPGQGIVAYNQHGPAKQDHPLPNGELVQPKCPDFMSGWARKYFDDHIDHLFKDRILGMSNFEMFLSVCSAWGDWRKWDLLVAEMEAANPAGLGLVEFASGVARVSLMQKEKQKAEAHFSRMHALFFKQAKTVFGARGEEEDDEWPD